MQADWTMPLAVILERRESAHPWQDFSWRTVAVSLDVPAAPAPMKLQHGPNWVQFYAGSLELELHRSETEGYRINLSQESPRVYVVLRLADDDLDQAGGELTMAPFHLTACPDEAQGYIESGDEIVDGVAMPEVLIAELQRFVDRHHVERPFVKRKNRRHDATPGPVSEPNRKAKRE